MTDTFAKLNPFKKVPVLEHDGFRLTESVAIFQYLCRTYPVNDHWYPKDSQKQARVDEYMSWQHITLRAYGSMVFQVKVIIPRMTGEAVNQKRAAFFENGLEGVLDTMETIWLKDNPYIAGKELSIADLLAVTELEQPGMTGYDVKDGRPNIAQYMNRVRLDLQPHYDDVHSLVYKVKESYTKQQAKL